MTDYSSYTQQDFQVTDLAGGSVWTHGLVNAGGSGTLSNPFKWQAALSSTGGGQFTLHYWRSGSTNNWGHAQRTDITSTVSGGVVTVAFSGSNIFTFNESDAFVSSGGGTGSSGPTAPAGTIQLSQNQLIFKVLSTSPSSSGVVSYELYKDGVLTTMNFTGHTHGQTTSRFATANDGLWVLKIVSTTGLYQSEDLASLTVGSKKKVFCNFW